ncbi:MAG TPA: glycine--tRNA ligase subunit beta [Polyangiaceae bacterium]|nr:glycine--tRNA ligase subunit beta [Polyangiaceae bacterium]
MHQDLLFEIGVEELPSSFVAGALLALPGLATKRLKELRLEHGALGVYGTPRRLTLVIEGLADRQTDLSEELTGPPATAAFDKEGKPTKAAEAFAKKLGCTIDALRQVETPKGKYLAGTRRLVGEPTAALLGPALAQWVGEIPFRKSMRWGAGDATFGRPIHWLVAVYGGEVVRVSFAGVTSGRASRGHRFLAPGTIEMATASAPEYLRRLRDAHVFADPQERANIMKERLLAAARAAGGELVDDEFLIGENLGLVEEPHVILGSFDASYLSLPETVILEVMRGHQRYFGVRGKDGTLRPSYLAVVNTAENIDNVRKGNDRVMRARLADARFFYDEDLKIPLAARREKLAGIVFQNRLGHMLAKSERIEGLTERLGALLRFPPELVDTAKKGARLAKCDLVSLMVGEFPDLQGTMGREYALAQKEPAQVADVIRDHYAPRGAKDSVAAHLPAALVALADRFDTLVGCFGVGLSPTGAADPFALRRAALGVLRTVVTHKYDLSISGAVEEAYSGFAGVKLDLALTELAPKLSEFFRERLRGLLAGELPADVVDACLAAESDHPTDVLGRVQALAALAADVRARAGEVFKRATNIAKEAPSGAPLPPNEVAADAPATEVALFAAFANLGQELDRSREAKDFGKAFAAIAAFAPALHQFFEAVFVMVDDEKLRGNRLRLMRAISERCTTFAHFQLLS